jgi:hypothetical protein
MTAVVGILNKQAVAIAADSAVTIGGSNGRKIFNRANKVFTLSKHHPVGIMIFNSATFMLTPWETIIKVYRKQLGTTHFPTVKHYEQDFIQFLRDKDFYSTDEDKKNQFYNFANALLADVIQQLVNENSDILSNITDENKVELMTRLEQKVGTFIHELVEAGNYIEEFADYQYAEFIAFSDDILNGLIDNLILVNGYQVNDDLSNKIKNLVYEYLKSKETFTNFTGLIFTGFGEDEIYPSLIPINISFAMQGRLRFFLDQGKEAYISNQNNGAIRPFAQTDVIDTILAGIDPRLDDIYLKNFEVYFSKYNGEILERIGDTNPELSAQLQGLDIGQLVKEYAEKNMETKQSNYIFPLMDAVSNLSKEDLAEMAESLIYLTYLKRRITFAEESVGGPVDVAVISKGDGFIWIKRKHYFKPELNQYFFNNYFDN